MAGWPVSLHFPGHEPRVTCCIMLRLIPHGYSCLCGVWAAAGRESASLDSLIEESLVRSRASSPTSHSRPQLSSAQSPTRGPPSVVQRFTYPQRPRPPPAVPGVDTPKKIPWSKDRSVFAKYLEVSVGVSWCQIGGCNARRWLTPMRCVCVCGVQDTSQLLDRAFESDWLYSKVCISVV